MSLECCGENRAGMGMMGAGRIMTYGIMGRSGGQEPLGPHRNPQYPQCSLGNTLIS